jgi:hypothetical protein
MNTFSTSPTMTLNLARYTPTGPAEQTQARATLRALKAQQRSARKPGWSPWAALVRRYAVTGSTSSHTSRPAIAG